MDKRRKNIFAVIGVIVVVLVLFGIITDRDNVFCYDTNVAHPNIVDLGAELYMQETGKNLTSEQIDCLRQGAEDEDMPIRWMNHFYDPIYNVGFKSTYLTAKDWSRASGFQRDYSLGDQTWQRAIQEYQDGNELQALCTLGHVLHLIADMSVPAHTRDDAHPSGDSYEQFVKYNWDLLASGLKNIDIDMVYYSNLDAYFNNLANYSNNNFYSDDTIESDEYKVISSLSVEIKKLDSKVTHKFYKNKKGNYYLYFDKVIFNWQNILFNNIKEKELSLKNKYILTDYTKHLLPQAIGNTAGVLKLFFEEVEKEHDFDLEDNKISFIGKMGNMLGWGVNKLADFKQYIGGNKDVVKADEQVIESVMNSVDSTDLDMDSNNAIEDVEYLEDVNPVDLERDFTEVIREVEGLRNVDLTDVTEDVEGVEGVDSTDLKKDVIDVVEDTEVINEDVVEDDTGGEDVVEDVEESVDVDDDFDTDTETSQPVYYGGGGGTTQNNTNEQSDNDNTTSTTSSDEETATTTPSDENYTTTSTPTTTSTITTSTTVPTINIVSHNNINYTNVSSTTIIVTSSENVVEIYINSSTAQFSSSTWQTEVYLVEGENIFEIYGQDSDENQSVTSTINIILDTTAPEVLNVESEQIDFTTPTIRVSWEAQDVGVGGMYYDLEYSIDNGDWIGLVTSTASTTYDLIVENLHKYDFRVKAYDNYDYASEWKQSLTAQPDWSKTVIVNEIAWMGTDGGHTSDEWLELYNNTENDIDLSDWKISVSGNIMNWDNDGHIIPAKSYYLLERSDDDTILGVNADGFFTLSGGLSNGGENLILMDSTSSTIDQVGCLENWFAGSNDNYQYRSMERLDTVAPGSVSSTWQTSDSIAPKVRPQGGSVIFGSPGYSNTGNWLLKQNIEYYYASLMVDNTLTLTKENSPYYFDADTKINPGVTIIVEPGVVLVGENKSAVINVKGVLNLLGTAEEPIVFTSALDTDYIQKNLSELTTSSSNPGDWSRLEIEEGGKVNIDNVKFHYGGQTFTKGTGWVYGTKWLSQVLRNTGGTLNIKNSEIKYNYVNDEHEEYSTVIWTEAPLGYDSTTTIENCLLDGGYTAINLYGANNGQEIQAVLKNNNLDNFTNPDSAIWIKKTFPELENNSFGSNISDYISLDYFELSQDVELEANTKYLATGVKVPQGKTLTISPGVDLKLNGSVEVLGSLQAQGTVDNPINFIPRNDYWGSMVFNGSTSSLSHVNFDKGNDVNIRKIDKRGMIVAENSIVDFDNIVFMDGARPYYMLYLEDSDISLRDSIISWTDDYTGNKKISGINVSGGQLYLNNTTFNRMDRGIQIRSGAVVTMENMTLGHFQNISELNWWPATAFTF